MSDEGNLYIIKPTDMQEKIMKGFIICSMATPETQKYKNGEKVMFKEIYHHGQYENKGNVYVHGCKIIGKVDS